MGITYPEPRCDCSPNRAHHYTVLTGTIWRCKYCWATKWQPGNWRDACQFSDAIRKSGIDKAYRVALSRRPKTKVLLEKLEEIRLLRKVLPEEQLMIAIAAILTEHTPTDEELKIPDDNNLVTSEQLLKIQNY